MEVILGFLMVFLGTIICFDFLLFLFKSFDSNSNQNNKNNNINVVKKNESYEDIYNNLFKLTLNKFKEKNNTIVNLKQFNKLQEKYYKLVKLIDKDKFKMLEESLKNLLENSLKNILIISKLNNILESLDYDKLSKQNKKHYKINEDFLQKEKDKFKESLELYDYIILKLIDIETKNNYDYSDIKNYIDNLVNMNLNHNLDYLETKYLNVDLEQFGSNVKKVKKGKTYE